ncbi:hypothetical protein Ancab_010520, partial [Ancistrocladus abbreviatus]
GLMKKPADVLKGNVMGNSFFEGWRSWKHAFLTRNLMKSRHQRRTSQGSLRGSGRMNEGQYEVKPTEGQEQGIVETLLAPVEAQYSCKERVWLCAFKKQIGS